MPSVAVGGWVTFMPLWLNLFCFVETNILFICKGPNRETYSAVVKSVTVFARSFQILESQLRCRLTDPYAR